MYPIHRLETPPPTSRFRRPWSPEPFDPNPPQNIEGYHLRPGEHLQARRELSEVSVEALDLADYARTLNQREGAREAVVFHPYDSYPPSPQPLRPLSSRDSFPSTPPLSPAPSTSQSHSTRSPGRGHHGQHRPSSFPMPQHSVQSRPPYDSEDVLLTPPGEADAEIDIAQFPRFARHWYNMGPTDPTYGQSRMDADIFDPAYSPHKSKSFSPIPAAYAPPYLSSQASHSSRDVGIVPWGNSSSEGPPVDPEVKEERVRMLEREFGKDATAEQDEERLVGSVDSRGRLITEGPKKRLATRWTQALFALLAGGSSIYAAVVIKNPTPPPPSGKPPAYILYVLSVITFFLTAYMFLIYPSCCAHRRRKALDAPFTQGPGGMMVLPVPGGHTNEKKKKRKNGKGGGDGVQVNLIVDPGMFGAGTRDDEEDEETSEGESSAPGTQSASGRSRARDKGRRRRRRSVFAGLALEAQWKQARKMLKWGMFVDVLMLFAWGAEFVYILIGQRCPAGAFNGWCDAYNAATAAACLLCLFFGLSVFFDVKDLHASNTSPRTRTSR